MSAAGLFAAYGSASPNRKAALKVNNVVWTLTGSDSPLRQTLSDAKYRTRLNTFVGKPLPSVAKSRAVAAKAAPAVDAVAAVIQAQTVMQPSLSPLQAEPVAPAQSVVPEVIKDAVNAANRLRGFSGRQCLGEQSLGLSTQIAGAAVQRAQKRIFLLPVFAA